MLFSLVLVAATLAAWAAGRRSSTWRDHARRGMAVAMVVAGVAHLVQPDPFVQHLPGWVPAREALVLLSGLAEIGLGLALVARRTWRVAAGAAVALFLVAVWPANVYVAVAGVDVDGQPGGAYPWIRLPFQVLFVAWALWSTQAPSETSTPGAPPAATLAVAMPQGRRANEPSNGSSGRPRRSTSQPLRPGRRTSVADAVGLKTRTTSASPSRTTAETSAPSTVSADPAAGRTGASPAPVAGATRSGTRTSSARA